MGSCSGWSSATSLLLLAVGFGLLGPGCRSEAVPVDQGLEWWLDPGCPRGVSKNASIALATPMPAGGAKGYICPRRRSDYYRVEHTGTLLTIELRFESELTNVQITYEVLDSDGNTVAAAPAWTGSGPRHFHDVHCLKPGTYTIRVRSENEDAYDGQNFYELTASSRQDPDAGEPGNGTQAGALPLFSGTSTDGYISCKGDEDWFAITAGPDQTLEVSLKTFQATQLILAYSIWDGTTKVAEGSADGRKGPIDLHAPHGPLNSALCTVRIADRDGTRSDPAVPYTLTVTLQPQ